MRVLTWNLYHGRSRPPAGHDLLRAFAAALAGWAWDVALLQEVPPWWPPALAAATGAQQRSRLTSRNALLPLRRAIATRRPDWIKANGGGCNAILVRGEVVEHCERRLTWWPERRWAHAVLLADGTWAVNLHASRYPAVRAHADCERAAEAALAWAADGPVVLGGDFNLREVDLPPLEHVAGHHVDHVLARGLTAARPGEVLDRGTLSDHAPVAVSLRGEP